jgi:hypothetical protein
LFDNLEKELIIPVMSVSSELARRISKASGFQTGVNTNGSSHGFERAFGGAIGVAAKIGMPLFYREWSARIDKGEPTHIHPMVTIAAEVISASTILQLAGSEGLVAAGVVKVIYDAGALTAPTVSRAFSRRRASTA